MANEKRLIDANALIAQLQDKKNRYADGHSVYEDAVYIGIGKAIIAVNYAPTIEAISANELEHILSKIPSIGLQDYQKRAIVAAVNRACGKKVEGDKNG